MRHKIGINDTVWVILRNRKDIIKGKVVKLESKYIDSFEFVVEGFNDVENKPYRHKFDAFALTRSVFKKRDEAEEMVRFEQQRKRPHYTIKKTEDPIFGDEGEENEDEDDTY